MVKRIFNEAESYGWVVNDLEAREAYDFACDYFGKEELDSQIVRCLGSEELAKCLAFIFRMNEFDEWENRNADEDEFDESVNRGRRRRINERITNGGVGFDDVSSSVRPTKLGYEVGEYVPDSGYQTFSKTCGDFNVIIYSSDYDNDYTVYVNPKRGNVDFNWLENELSDIDFTNENALAELDDRLMELSGRGATSYGESRQRRTRRSKVRTESVKRNRKFRRR